MNKPDTHEEGYALFVVLILVVLMTIIGLSAITTSRQEISLAGTDRRIHSAFYDVESALNHAIAHFDDIYSNSSLYGTSASSLPLKDRPISNGSIAFKSPVERNGEPVAWIEVRAILQKNNKTASTLTTTADRVPSIPHLTSPPGDNDMSRFKGRRFLITATAIDPHTYTASSPTTGLSYPILQAGVVQAEAKDRVFHMDGM